MNKGELINAVAANGLTKKDAETASAGSLWP